MSEELPQYRKDILRGSDMAQVQMRRGLRDELRGFINGLDEETLNELRERCITECSLVGEAVKRIRTTPPEEMTNADASRMILVCRKIKNGRNNP